MRTQIQRQVQREAGDPLRARRAGSRIRELADLPDETCARRARHGDASAQEEIVRRFLPGVFNLLVRLLADRDRAADAAQEVFLRVHRKIDTYRSEFSFRSWIYAIAWNYARDQLRRRRREPRFYSHDAQRLDGWGRDGWDEAGGTKTGRGGPATPDEILDAQERVQWIRQALDRLPPPQRAMLILREYEGLTYEELARLLDWKLGTVKSRLNRARLKLKELLLQSDPVGFETGPVDDGDDL